jgi:RIO kinase 1
VAVPESLQKLVEDGVIEEIQQRLMSGKEASVYIVTYRGTTVAAKVYKARDRRSFKATSSYTEGRNQTRNSRDRRAMDRGTSYGKELMEDNWRDMEYRALFDAHHAGVRVPKPIMIYEDVLLMDLLLDENDSPAPRLADFDLSAEEAEAMLKEIYRQVRMLLSTGRIHGDLSAFNVLIAAGGPTIIDLPQVVEANGNNQARDILKRDLRNIVEHLARFDERLLRFVDCGDGLFHHFQRGTLDEAIQPQEMRREHGGGRRLRGEERADGQVGQARRGAPKHGRGRQPDLGYAAHGGGGRGPQHGGPQHGGPQHGGPQHGGP